MSESTAEPAARTDVAGCDDLFDGVDRNDAVTRFRIDAGRTRGVNVERMSD